MNTKRNRLPGTSIMYSLRDLAITPQNIPSSAQRVGVAFITEKARYMSYATVCFLASWPAAACSSSSVEPWHTIPRQAGQPPHLHQMVSEFPSIPVVPSGVEGTPWNKLGMKPRDTRG